MRKLLFAWLILSLFFAGAACADETVTAQVDKEKVTLNETITYKLNVVCDSKTPSYPQLPDFRGFHIVSQAQSTTVSYQTGQSDVLMTYVYILAPTSVGVFTINPSTVTIGGQVYSTQSFQIEVAQQENPPADSQTPDIPEQPDEGQPKISL